MDHAKVVLITGASSGFGKLTAEQLVPKGYRVFGTSRKESLDIHGIEMLALDVRSEDSVRQCVKQVMERAGRIDVLINNAGYGLGGFVEETSIGQSEALFATNFFGVVRVTQAVLPIMRGQNSGRIINVGSLAGLIGVPCAAFYVASKFALDGFTESLRLEVDQFHIQVSIIEPSFFKTNIANSVEVGNQLNRAYDSIREKVERAFQKEVESGEDPSQVAQLIARITETKHPKLRYRVGRDAVWIPRLKSVIPGKIFSYVLKRQFNLIS
ncbi:MAG: SDR family NAD(P)-dependent oxidoreductase [Deltaproteobacteria bacterium]|nr:SDR family NAD(P)-dependent oxidoreductase [Deltaproteobacteria bacterium]